MTDIMTKLRNPSAFGSMRHGTLKDAADEIDRLRAALQKIADRDSEGYESYDQMAREALSGKTI